MSFGGKSLAGLMFAVISGAGLLFAVYGLANMAWLAVAGETRIGVVTNYRDTPPYGTNRGSSRAQVVFTDHEGIERRVEMRFSRGDRISGKRNETHEIGEKVRVLHPRGTPQDAIMVDGTTIAWHIFMVLFCAMPFSLGVWLIRSDRKEQEEMGWNTRRF